MTGQRVADGRLIEKPTQFWTNSPDIGSALQGLICDNQPEHAHVAGVDTRRVQLYTWQFVSCVAHGCQSAIKKCKKGSFYLAYPVEERGRPDPGADWRKCPGCLGR
eukprot:7402297-Lingulodinium_polyedra.AAC.1